MNSQIPVRNIRIVLMTPLTAVCKCDYNNCQFGILIFLRSKILIIWICNSKRNSLKILMLMTKFSALVFIVSLFDMSCSFLFSLSEQETHKSVTIFIEQQKKKLYQLLDQFLFFKFATIIGSTFPRGSDTSVIWVKPLKYLC